MSAPLLGRAVHSGLRADRARLRDDFEALAAIGRGPSGGLTREAYTPAYLQARAFVRSRLDQAGLTTRVDAVGNLFGRTRVGSEPVVLTGSHLDAVPNGGVFDGAAGVIAALEAVRTIHTAGVPLVKPLEVVAFVEEEGRFTGLLGSAVMVGSATLDGLTQLRDLGGVSFGEVLTSVGLEIARLGEAARPASEIAAFVELHIEQGAVLDRAGVPIGIVTAIAGTHRLAVEILGRADHAGATPMGARQDALLAAAEVVLAAREIVRNVGRATARVTVGQLTVEPNVTSAVAERVRLVVDIRDVEVEPRARMAAQVEQAVERACAREGLTWTMHNPMSAPPGLTDPTIRLVMEAVCEALEVRYERMMSGASHDAQNLAQVVPTGMIFVPSRGGRSHSPAEFTDLDQLAAGTDVLIGTLLSLAA